MADQPRNAHMLTRHGGALQLDKTWLNNSEKLREAIQTVLNDVSYKHNAERLAKILEDQPHKPKDVVLKHCDFAVQFGPLDTLNSEGRLLNTFQYYSVDIVLAIFVILSVILFVVYLVIKLLFRFLGRLFSISKRKVD